MVNSLRGCFDNRYNLQTQDLKRISSSSDAYIQALEDAQAVLGHASIQATQIYWARQDKLPRLTALELR